MRNGICLFSIAALSLTFATRASAQLRGGPLALQPRPQPAFRAEDFVEFIGLNASPFERYLASGPFQGAGTKYPPETFFDLGVRYYRTGLKNDLTPADMPQRVAGAFAKCGARPMLLIDPRKDGSPDELVALLEKIRDRAALAAPGAAMAMGQRYEDHLKNVTLRQHAHAAQTWTGAPRGGIE